MYLPCFHNLICREFFYLTTSPVYDSDPGAPQSPARTLHSWTLTVAVVRSLVHVCSSRLLVITFNSDLRHRQSHVERQLFCEDKKSDIQDVNMDSPFVNEPLADSYEHLQPPPQQVDPVDVPDLNIAGPSSSSSKKNGDPKKVPEKVIDLFLIDGQITFLMKWRRQRVATLVPAKVANLICPQLVIKYYEGLTTWKS